MLHFMAKGTLFGRLSTGGKFHHVLTLQKKKKEGTCSVCLCLSTVNLGGGGLQVARVSLFKKE